MKTVIAVVLLLLTSACFVLAEESANVPTVMLVDNVTIDTPNGVPEMGIVVDFGASEAAPMIWKIGNDGEEHAVAFNVTVKAVTDTATYTVMSNGEIVAPKGFQDIGACGFESRRGVLITSEGAWWNKQDIKGIIVEWEGHSKTFIPQVVDNPSQLGFRL